MSGRVQSEHDSEPGQVRRATRGEGRARRPGDQEVKRIKGREKGSDNQMTRLYGEGQLGVGQSSY